MKRLPMTMRVLWLVAWWLGLSMMRAQDSVPAVQSPAETVSPADEAPAEEPPPPPPPPATYTNPLIEGNLADPAVLFHEGVYYLYATGEVDGDNGYRVFTSTNLVDWERGPVVFRPGLPHVWAPDIWRDPDSGRFYLYYTADRTVGVADGDHPLGPFEVRRELITSAIDAHLFRDDDGRLYLYYVKLPGFRITVQVMKSPTEIDETESPRRLIRPDAAWEQLSGQVTEGPWMIKHEGRYLLLYSGSGADTPNYAVGYATASHPLGPFVKAPHNPIVHRGDGVYGPGHGCVVRDGIGQFWHVYHQKRTDQLEWDRFICLDLLWLDDRGDLQSRATRDSEQLAPVFPQPAPPEPETVPEPGAEPAPAEPKPSQP